MAQRDEVMEWRGCEVVDRDGDKVGKLDEIYLDRDTGEPEWAVVNTGLFGRRSSFVPLKDALREGDMVRVPYDAGQIKDAPNVEADGELSREEEQRVYAHYGLEYSREESGSGLPQGGETVRKDDADTRTEQRDMPEAGEEAGQEDDTAGSGLRLRRFVREEVGDREATTVREERVTTTTREGGES